MRVSLGRAPRATRCASCVRPTVAPNRSPDPGHGSARRWRGRCTRRSGAGYRDDHARARRRAIGEVAGRGTARSCVRRASHGAGNRGAVRRRGLCSAHRGAPRAAAVALDDDRGIARPCRRGLPRRRPAPGRRARHMDRERARLDGRRRHALRRACPPYRRHHRRVGRGRAVGARPDGDRPQVRGRRRRLQPSGCRCRRSGLVGDRRTHDRARRSLMRDALGLLTTFGRRTGPGRIHARSLPWFPLVGAGLGLVVGGAWWVAQQWWPRPVAAGLVLLVDAGCTGLLHHDGLADAADGLLPHATTERRLTIMRTPELGAFGVSTLALFVVLQAAALASRAADAWLIAALWCAARALVAAVPAVVPYARAEGIATPLLDGARVWPVLAIVPAFVLAFAADGIGGGVAVLAAALVGAATIAFAVRRVGGFTGDVLGAAIMLAE